MAGRESRRALLAPSFLVVATALGCGGVSTGEGRGGSAGSGGSGGSGGTGTFGGAGANPPVMPGCPEARPESGTFCASSTGACTYENETGAGCPVSFLARCVDARWQVTPSNSCNPPMPFVCPAQVQPGAACSVPAGAGGGGSCPYSACDGQIAVSVRCVDGKWEQPSIACNPPPATCPTELPPIGGDCGNYMVKTFDCAYPTTECPERLALCEGGAWKSISDCIVGAGGSGGDGGQGANP